MTDRQDCPFRHENGNCLRIGGFCLAVNDEICAAIQGAYSRGVADAISFVNSAKEIEKANGIKRAEEGSELGLTDREKMINELTFQLHSKEVIEHHAPIQLSVTDANKILKLLREWKPDCEHAEHDSNGCLGYSGCLQDDEPIEACKRCDKYTSYAEKEGEVGCMIC